jgi:hypothetical protein
VSGTVRKLVEINGGHGTHLSLLYEQKRSPRVERNLAVWPGFDSPSIRFSHRSSPESQLIMNVPKAVNPADDMPAAFSVNLRLQEIATGVMQVCQGLARQSPKRYLCSVTAKGIFAELSI